jgi:hypothetical protein
MAHDDHTLPLRRENAEDRLFDVSVVARRWQDVWTSMPAFEMGAADSLLHTIIHFRSYADVERFKSILGDAVWWIPGGQGSGWFGGRDADWVAPMDMLWRTEDRSRLPRYPVYVPSVGRWETPLTASALEALGVPHRVVVEPAQRDAYARALGEDRLLVLPEDFSARNTGSIPARNWIWEHSLAEGHARHWVIDDNVRGFLRVHRNRRVPVDGPSIFVAAEDFTDRFENVAFSGFNYMYLVKERDATFPPFYLNTRVYSMILVNNSLPYRWRGRYNEDTDICIRALKDGWCTILINAFLGDKAPTLTMAGGNTDTVYATGDKRRAFADSLVEQHPDVARRVRRYGRWHHEVDYSVYSHNKLRPRADAPLPDDPEYGMRLVRDRRTSRYPSPHRERQNGSAEGRAAPDDQASDPGDGQEGDIRPGQSDRVRRGEGGGVRRRRGNLSSPAWRPRI